MSSDDFTVEETTPEDAAKVIGDLQKKVTELEDWVYQLIEAKLGLADDQSNWRFYRWYISQRDAREEGLRPDREADPDEINF